MGKKYVIDEETLRGIADAIRAKKGTTDPISVTSMASEIESIPAGRQAYFCDYCGKEYHTEDEAYHCCRQFACPICGEAYPSEESASECESSHAVEVTCEPHLSENGILTFTHSGWDEYENAWYLYDAASDEIIAEETATCFTEPVDLSSFMTPGETYYVEVRLDNSDGVSGTSARTDSTTYVASGGGGNTPQPWVLLLSTSGFARLVGGCDEADYDLYYTGTEEFVTGHSAYGNDCSFYDEMDEGDEYYAICRPYKDSDYHGPVKSNDVVYDGNKSYLGLPATPECYIDMGDLAMRTSSLNHLGAVTVICWVDNTPHILILNQNIDTDIFWENGDGVYEHTSVITNDELMSALNKLLVGLGVSEDDVTIGFSLVAHGVDMSGNFSYPSAIHAYNY